MSSTVYVNDKEEKFLGEWRRNDDWSLFSFSFLLGFKVGQMSAPDKLELQPGVHWYMWLVQIARSLNVGPGTGHSDQDHPPRLPPEH